MRPSHHKTTMRPETALLLALIISSPATTFAEENNEMELQLIMSPGKESGATITFSTNASKPVVKRRSTPLLEIDDLDTGGPALAVDPDTAFSGFYENQDPPAVPDKVQEVAMGHPEMGEPAAPTIQLHAHKNKTRHTVSAPVLPPGIEKELEGVAATEAPPPARKYFSGFRPDIALSGGYRSDTLSWKMLPYIASYNYLPEVAWDDLDIFEMKVDGKWSGASGLYVRGNFGLGWIDNNEVNEPGYVSLSRDIDKEKGTVMDASAGVGYRISAPSSSGGTNFHFVPMLGYGFNDQNLAIRSGEQVLKTHYYSVDEALEEDANAYLLYSTTWKGPWIGTDMILEMGEKHSLSASLTYHFLRYEAETEFHVESATYSPLFEHMADGGGISASLAYQYDFTENWFLNFQFDYRNYWAEDGTDTSYYASYWGEVVESTEDLETTTVGLDEVQWESFSFLFGIGFTF